MTPSREMKRPDLMNPMMCSLWWVCVHRLLGAFTLCAERGSPISTGPYNFLLTAHSGAQLVGDADGVTYGFSLLEHGQHRVGDVGPRDGEAVAYVAVC